MLSEEKLQGLKEEWRDLATDSMAKAISAIEEYMPEAAEKHNTLLALKGRLNDANQKNIMGVLSNEQLQLLYNQLRYDLLTFIDELEGGDFEAASQGMPMGVAPNQPRRGALLHKIPRRMAVGEEEECIIRLAYERAVIANNLEITEEVEVREVCISKVMQAELIDPSEEPAFSIRSYSDEEQFLQEGEYTEWKFFVTPLREGAFKLLLKLSVVEIIEGKERLRNISWEEMIQIVAAAKETEPAEFTTSGIHLSFERGGKSNPPGIPAMEPAPAPSPTQAGGYSGDDYANFEEVVKNLDRNYEPSRSIPPVSPQPAAPTVKRSRGNSIRRLSIAATVVIAIGVALFIVQPVSESSQNPGLEQKEEPYSPADKGPNKSKPIMSVDAKAWQKVKVQNTVEAYQKFIRDYPDSKYVQDAKEQIELLE